MSGTNQLPNIGKIFGNDEDEDDFKAPAGSSLAAIFGESKKNHDAENAGPSLRYVSPKQSIPPRPRHPAIGASQKHQVFHAKAVHGFQLKNGEYASVGKLGMALTGNASTKEFHLILYRGTQDYVSIVSITSEFVYTVQPKNYASYYDANKENWSILFDSDEAGIEFARQIVLSKYLCNPTRNVEKILYQDLNAVITDTTAVEGNTVSMKYTTNMNLSLPIRIDINFMETMNLQISKNNNWEQILIGTKIGLRRFVILPPNKQIGLGLGFPRDRDIAMEVEVISIVATEQQTLLTTNNKPIEQSYKATIFSRMAKMGQSILPKLPPSTTTDSEDTEDEVYRKSPRQKRVESMDSSLQKKQLHLNQSLENDTKEKLTNREESISTALPVAQRSVMPAPVLAKPWTQNSVQSQYVTMDTQLFSIPATATPGTIDPSLNILLSETRMQNAEMRMGMSKIADNVQKLLDKFHSMELQKAATPTSDKMLEATLKVLLEVNKSKEEAEAMNSKAQKMLTGEKNLSQNSHALDEESSLKVDMVKKEPSQENELLTSQQLRIDQVTHDNEALQETNGKLRSQIEGLERDIGRSQDTVTQLSNELRKYQDTESNYREERACMQLHIMELTKKCEKFEENLKSTNHVAQLSDDNRREIKRIMNQVFQRLMVSFTDESYSTDYIKETIATTIKQVTLNFLDSIKKPEDSVEMGKIEDTTVEKSSLNL